MAVKKVHRVTAPDGRVFLLGLLGNAAFATDVLRWMHGGPHPGACLDADREHDCAVVVDDRRRVWRLSSHRLTYREYPGKLHSAGAGQEVAMGALMYGASAKKSVEITMQVSDYAARGVDIVSFNG